jgi:hypothetical protein
MKVAYVVSRFPHVTETFIVRELNGVDAAADLVSLNDRGDIAVSIRPEWGIAHAAVYRRIR